MRRVFSGAALLLLLSSPLVRPQQLQPCTLDGIEAPIACGTVEVPENRARPKERRLALKVVVLRATTVAPQPDPLFILAGGPGQAASDNVKFYARIFSGVRRERDIVLVDQRGTGGSNALNCDLYGTATQDHLRDLFPIETVRQCVTDWKTRADLRHYTTAAAVRDLDAVRQALGYAQVNLFGTSYGTRAAQVYLRRYPQRVRTAILKGVASVAQPLTEPMAADAQRALQLLFDDCAADPECAAAYPRLRQQFVQVMAQLAKGEVEFQKRENGKPAGERHLLSRGAVATTLRALLQSTESSAELPLLIHAAAGGDFAPLGEVVLTTRRGFSKAVSVGTFLAVIAAEDMPFRSARTVLRASRRTFLRDEYYQQLQRATALLPRHKIAADHHQPVRSHVPVLLISGFLDPATPPSGAEEVAKHLPNSLHVVVRNGSHSYSGLGPCVDHLMTEFITRGSAAELDTSCAEQIRRPAFVLPAARR